MEGGLGESKISIQIYVDESGNTGRNIFDASQPDYYTAALISKGDFDAQYTHRVTAIAAKVGGTSIHANELGLGRLETIAADLFALIRRSDAYFFVSRVEKKYLLAAKMFDVLFDAGENAAVAWHIYNIRPMRILFVFKLAHIIDDVIARQFWQCLLLPRETDARAMLPSICESLKARLELLPDQGSRKVFEQGLEWITQHPECVQFANEQKVAKKGHFPNLVAFTNLLAGVQEFSRLTKRKVSRIIHDEQNEFGSMLETNHALFSNASPDVLRWAGETYSLQMTPGSRFEMKRDEQSVGIQMADVALWLYSQSLKGKNIPPNCKHLLQLILSRGWQNDFSFEGLDKELRAKFGKIMSAPMTPEKLDAGERMVIMAEERRRLSMEQFNADGVPPFMRPVSVIENSSE